MADDNDPVAELWADAVGFPPASGFLVLPRQPRAAAAGLGLYDAVTLRQRTLSAAAGRLMPVLVRLLPKVEPRRGPQPDWWHGFLRDVAAPEVGEIRHLALRLAPNGRTAALLLDDESRPLAFAKITLQPSDGLGDVVERQLRATPPQRFTTPEVLRVGERDGWHWRLYRPLARGRHRSPPDDPARVQAILAELQRLLAPLVPVAGDDPVVVCHGDFTPRNLRVTADGSWVLFDFDNARRGPRVADELHYWCAAAVYRRAAPRPGDPRVIFDRLAAHASREEIAAAAAWPQAPERAYRAAELELRRAVLGLAAIP